MNPAQATLQLLQGAARHVQSHARSFLLGALMVAAVAAVTIRSDKAWGDALMESRTDDLRWLARRVSACGDFHTGTLAVVASLWLAGALRKNRSLQTAALACLLAATFAGITANVTRTLAGRPRPSANMVDGFYGPRFTREFQSFPSAHSATSLGTAAALAVAAPLVGAPLAVLALGVPWSRFYLHDHYVTDVLVGGAMGIWFGAAFGFAARRVSGDRKPAA